MEEKKREKLGDCEVFRVGPLVESQPGCSTMPLSWDPNGKQARLGSRTISDTEVGLGREEAIVLSAELRRTGV